MPKILEGRRNPHKAPEPTPHDLEQVAIEAFKAHWADVLRRARASRPLWKKLWRCFEADTDARSKMLAEKFFGADHAQKMCLLTGRQVRHRLACYLPRAIEYALEEFSQPAEQTEF